MDIEGFGEKLVQRFYEEGLVRALPEIYDLTAERLEQLEGFQRKSAENLVDSIERSKRQPFHRVLYALGIPGIGGVNARALASHFGSIDRLMDAAQEEIEAVEGIGPVLAGDDPGDPRRAAEPAADRGPARARASTWSRRPPSGSAGGWPLAGKTFVLTGTLPGHDRASEATERIRRRAAR